VDLDVLVRDIRFFLSQPKPILQSKDASANIPADAGAPILIVDDKPEPALSLTLEKEGYLPYVATRGTDGVMLAHKIRPRAALLDYSLPDVDGKELLRLLRAHPRTRDIPLVMRTAAERRGLERDCLNVGADDFLRKGSHDLSALPLRLSRLLAQRASASRAAHFEVRVDPARRLVWIGADAVEDLTQMEYALLVYLIEKKSTIASWGDLQRDVWHIAESDLILDREPPTIAVHHGHLRRKLGPNAACLVVHRGMGLQFDPSKAARTVQPHL
jgi:DNA-binding response OmpR family regulator